MKRFDHSSIVKEFPQLETKVKGHQLCYLDNAASTLKLGRVCDAIDQHYRYQASNIHRGVHTLSEEGTEKFEQTRDLIKDFINAQKREEIVFTKGTTESLNLVAHCFGQRLRPGDQILISTMEHHSNIVPWQMIAEKTGAQLVEIPLNDQAQIDSHAYQQLLNDKVKIVSMAHISNALGTINPIETFIQQAHQVGAIFVVDAAQSAAHLKINVQDLDCDFLAFSAHKMFGPTGIGVLYGKEKWLDEMPPYQGGGDMIDVVTIEKTTYNHLPHKFEAGTPAIAEVIAFSESIRFLNETGLSQIMEYECQLLEQATSELEKIEGLTIYGPRDLHQKSAVISFNIEGIHPHDLGTLLDQQGIAIRTGHHCTQPLMNKLATTATARASFALYNHPQQIEYLAQALKKSCELLK